MEQACYLLFYWQANHSPNTWPLYIYFHIIVRLFPYSLLFIDFHVDDDDGEVNANDTDNNIALMMVIIEQKRYATGNNLF